MNLSLESLLERFLRNYTSPFTVNDLAQLMKTCGKKVEKNELTDFLHMDERVFALEGNHFITQAGAFTGMFFSFVPTQQELDQKVFVPGDRCMPFVDGEMLSCSLNFEYAGKILPKTTFETDCNTARDLFTFYGDEYASQYIGADPINADLNLANNGFELPPKLRLTAVSLERVMEDFDFKKGDRILCRVNNWDRGIIELFPETEHNKNPFIRAAEISEREKWCKKLEDALLLSFDKMGPCNSMEQQLGFAFYENRRELCSPECGSLHEFLDKATRVGMELFGVETRLWKKNEDVPAVGKWNMDTLFHGSSDKDDFAPARFSGMPEYIIDCFIKDQLYEKKDDLDSLCEAMIPSSIQLTEKERADFTLHIMRRNAIIRNKYNRFADFAMGSIRHDALSLYSRVGDLVYEVDCAGKEIVKFPQQELVTLSQLFAHITRMLEMLAGEKECADEEKTAIKLSLEGMEYNFEDIRTRLKSAVDRSLAKRFKVI
ncbi:MAG: hypothetical protein K6B73_03855 [Treponema sp.]|nr:hypothetical protein [Treponema sp.]